jgi:hypothetical protein
MKKGRGRYGGELVVHRSYARSRHEKRFGVAAYDLIVPRLKLELSTNLWRAEGTFRVTEVNPGTQTGRPA